MAATKGRTYVKRFQELEEIREKVEKDRFKSYMTEKNGIDNDTRKWFLIRILDIPRTYVESHVDHTHHETLEFLETCSKTHTHPTHDHIPLIFTVFFSIQ